MKSPIDKEVKRFIIAVRARALQDTIFAKPTEKQVVRLVIQITTPLSEPKNRKKILSAIAGFEIQSQNMLTSHYHSVLIDETLENRSDEILRRIEKYIEAEYSEQPWNLLPRQGISGIVPNLQPAHS